MIEVPQLLSIPEAAKALGVREATLRVWRVDRREIAFVKVGDSLRVDVREIERYIEIHTERPTVAKNVAKARGGAVRRGIGNRSKTIDFPA